MTPEDPKREKIGAMHAASTVVRLPTAPLTEGEREAARWLIRKALEAWRQAA